MAMLACLLIQASTGLFADDAILTEGPLADSVPTATSKLLTGIHVLNAKVLYALIALHLAAIAYHGLVARENLVRPMITGAKRLPAAAVAGDRTAPGLLAAVLAALAAAAVAWIVDG
jgi:cytochrome b